MCDHEIPPLIEDIPDVPPIVVSGYFGRQNVRAGGRMSALVECFTDPPREFTSYEYFRFTHSFFPIPIYTSPKYKYVPKNTQ